MPDTLDLWSPAIDNLRWRGLRLDKRTVSGILHGGMYLYMVPLIVGEEEIYDSTGSLVRIPHLLDAGDVQRNYNLYGANVEYELIDEIPPVIGSLTECEIPFPHYLCYWSDDPVAALFWNCLLIESEQVPIVLRMIRDYQEHLVDAGVEYLCHLIESYYVDGVDPQWCYEYLNATDDKDGLWREEYESYAGYFWGESFDDLVIESADVYEKYLEHGEYEGITKSILPLHEVVDDDGLMLINRLRRQKTTHRTAYIASLPPDEIRPFLQIERYYE